MIRMWIAEIWDRLFPRSCWAESCMWAMGYEGCRLRREAAGKGAPGYCPDAASRPDGVGCWCGKFRVK